MNGTKFSCSGDGFISHGSHCFLLPKVNKIEINYAKTAKKMDMKRLKSSMWTLLTESPEKPKEVNSVLVFVQRSEVQLCVSALLCDLDLRVSFRSQRLWTNRRSVETKCSVKPPRRCSKGQARCHRVALISD